MSLDTIVGDLFSSVCTMAPSAQRSPRWVRSASGQRPVSGRSAVSGELPPKAASTAQFKPLYSKLMFSKLICRDYISNSLTIPYCKAC
jgi:hypothetical protein